MARDDIFSFSTPEASSCGISLACLSYVAWPWERKRDTRDEGPYRPPGIGSELRIRKTTNGDAWHNRPKHLLRRYTSSRRMRR